MAKMSNADLKRQRAEQAAADKEAERYREREQRRLRDEEAKQAHKKRLKDSRKRLRKEVVNQKDRERHQYNAAIRHPQRKPVSGKYALGEYGQRQAWIDPVIDLTASIPKPAFTVGEKDGVVYRVYLSQLGDQRILETDAVQMEAQGLNVQDEINKAVEQAINDAHREAVLNSGVFTQDQGTDECELSPRTDCDSSSQQDNSVAGPIGSTLEEA